MSSIREAVRKSMDDAVSRAIELLSYIGEQAVNEARNMHSYTDRTGNLTSSMGYVVLKDGRPVDIGEFNKILKADVGPEDGRSFALSLAGNYPEGLTLIVVAGMKYAAYVADKGYNVLDSSEILARKLARQLIGGKEAV